MAVTEERDIRPRPLVSVVVPVYNGAALLGRALASALAQTMPDLEVLIVDDASSDATPEVARRFSEGDPRVRVFRNGRNLGPAGSRNRAIAEARGAWIAPLDADDAWASRRLETLATHAAEADVISDDVRVVRRTGRAGREVSWSVLEEQGLPLRAPRPLDALDFVRHDLGLLHPIMRGSFLREHGFAYDPGLRFNEDYVLYFDLLTSGARWLQLPDAFYFYYKHEDAVTRDKGALWRSAAETAQGLLRHPSVTGDRELTAALEARVREARGHVAFADALETFHRQGPAGLARTLREDPSKIPLLARFVTKRLRSRARRTKRRLRTIPNRNA